MRGLRLALGVVLALGPGVHSSGAQAPATATRATAWGRITYVSGGTIYVDAGSRAGLREGARLDVVRGGVTIAELAVAFISSSRSACTAVSTREEPAVGDSVRFSPVAQPVIVAAALDSTGGTATRRRRPDALRGRLGLRYLMVQPGNGLRAWSQPAFDLRLDGQHLGGSPLGVMLDVRAYRQRAGTTGRGRAASSRVYQGSVAFTPEHSPLRVTVGRQLVPSLSTMGIFDGLSLEMAGRHASVGAVGGSQPDAVSFGISRIVREYGAWVQAHNAPNSIGAWSVTLGGIGSYDRGAIDREFGYVQALVARRHVTLMATQEVDVNRGWKADMEGRSTVPTSTFAVLRLSPVDAFSVNLGYDNRRSVRLYRDFLDPVTEFDDTFRQGGWAGASLNMGTHVRVGTDVRQGRGGIGGDTRSFTSTAGVTRLTPLHLGMHLRHSSYGGAVAEGDLVSGSVEVNPLSRFRLEASAGTRTDRRPVVDAPTRSLAWRGLDADFGIGRALYVMLSAYRERGDAGTSTQGYVSLSWRF